MDQFLDQRSRRFQGVGWNVAGSSLLAVSSWIAQQNRLRVKRKFAEVDVFLVLVLVSLAIKFLSSPLIVMLLVSLAVSYVVKKLLAKFYLEDILENLSRDSQKLLVLKLMDFCELKNIDPESVSDLGEALLDEQISDKMQEILSKFVTEETKYFAISI